MYIQLLSDFPAHTGDSKNGEKSKNIGSSKIIVEPESVPHAACLKVSIGTIPTIIDFKSVDCHNIYVVILSRRNNFISISLRYENSSRHRQQ